jgi:hypothetical protein
MSGTVEGDALVPKTLGTPIPDRLLIGTEDGIALIDTAGVPTPVSTLDNAQSQPFERGIAQGRGADGDAFYSGYGASSQKSGLIAFKLAGQNLDDIVNSGEVKHNDVAPTPIPGCEDVDADGSVEFAGIQWFRLTPAVNDGGTHVFATGRGTGGEITKHVTAWRALAQTTPFAPGSLAACHKVSTGAGLPAPPGYARVPVPACCHSPAGCSSKDAMSCCGDAERIDRLFIGDKNNAFFAVNFCYDDDPLNPVEQFTGNGTEFWLREQLGQIRVQPSVALDLGTVYAFSEHGEPENVYAFDINTGRIKWEYDLRDTFYDTGTACSAPGVKNCFPAPVAAVVDADPDSFELYVVDETGCWDKDRIAILIGADHIPQPLPTPTPSFMSADADIDTNAPEHDLAAGGHIINLTTGQLKPVACFGACVATLDLVAGWNEMVGLIRDKSSKEGQVRFRINFDPEGCDP